MKKVLKILAFLIIAILSILLISPGWIGLYYQRHYQKMLSFYESIPGIHIKLSRFHRGWFTSDAVLTVSINNDYYNDVLTQLGFDKKDIPTEYVINQQIQHGPIFYAGSSHPTRIGMILAKNTVQTSPKIKQFYTRLGVQDALIQQDDEWVTWSGRYLRAFTFSPIQIGRAGEDLIVNLKKVAGQFEINSSTSEMNGRVNLDHFVATNQSDSIRIPGLSYDFQLPLTQNPLWAGSSSLTISGLGINIFDIKADFSTIYYFSSADTIHNQFSTGRELTIDQMVVNDQSFGPLRVQVSINNMNATALVHMLTVYRDIMNRGELYESQLEKKMAQLMPTLIHQGSNIKLSFLELKTPQGQLHMDGYMQWNTNKEVLPEEWLGILQSANALLNIRVATTLVDQLIDFYATSPMINDVESDLDEDQINQISDEIDFHMQNNAALLDMLVYDGQLRDADAIDLYNLQKNMVSIEDYADQIRHILWEKYLTLPSSYYLYWGYLSVDNAILKLQKMIQESQHRTQAELKAKINAWIKNGSIKQEQGYYNVVIKQENGKVGF